MNIHDLTSQRRPEGAMSPTLYRWLHAVVSYALDIEMFHPAVLIKGTHTGKTQAPNVTFAPKGHRNRNH